MTKEERENELATAILAMREDLEDDLYDLTLSFPRLGVTKLARDLGWPVNRLQKALVHARLRATTLKGPLR